MADGWWQRVVHPDDYDRVRDLRAESFRGRGQMLEYRVRHADDHWVWISSSASVREDTDGQRTVVGTWIDVTERKQLEARLSQSQKLEAAGRLAGGVAHDFNNLLTVILGTLDLIGPDLPPDSPLVDDLAEVRAAARRGADLTRQLLAFSRNQVVAPRRLDLNGAIHAVHGLLRRLVGADVELVLRTADDLGVIVADPGQIEQVLVNLAANARDAMPEGGRLTIETVNAELDASYAARGGPIDPGRYILLTVSDDGVGMSEETRSHAFEPFYTTKAEAGGTGLGLATVYGIVHQGGGHVWVYSEPGAGTTFKIYFPRVEAQAESIPVREEAPPVVGGRETILLVEDDDAVRAIAASVLRRLGYDVRTAHDGAEALRIITGDDIADIDLLVTDLVLPGTNGLAIARRYRERHPAGRTLFTSGYTPASVLHAGGLPAGSPFVSKPFTADALARAVRGALDRTR